MLDGETFTIDEFMTTQEIGTTGRNANIITSTMHSLQKRNENLSDSSRSAIYRNTLRK